MYALNPVRSQDAIARRDGHWVWAAGLALGWLLAPYPDFARDAWCACAFMSIALALLWRTRGPWALPADFALWLLLPLVPLVQWALGLIYFAGVAWMACAYLAGFALALWCGHRWESVTPGRGLDALFAAVGLAALLTVGMQCLQWLGHIDSAQWWLDWGELHRPAGNFAQPNIAATFLCWGLCALAWAAAQRRLGYWSATALAACLLWGVALTGSRTAWLGLTLVLLGTLHWRTLLPSRRVLWLVLALALYFVLSVVLVATLHFGVDEQTVTSLSSAHARLVIWHMALQALAEQPLQGFGWGQIYAAQLAVADRFPAKETYFISAHNLVLDLLLWVGVLLGACLLWTGLHWLRRMLPRVRTAQDMVLVFFVLLVLNHAMLELPLQYACMLLPLAWVLGALHQRLDAPPQRQMLIPRATVGMAMMAVAAVLTLVVADYAHLEQRRQDGWDFALSPSQPRQQLPHVLLLTHLRANLEMAEYPVLQAPITAHELQRLEAIATFSPQHASSLKVAAALAMNGQAERARWWMVRMCKLGPPTYCTGAKATWERDGRSHPEIAAIAWPDAAPAAHAP
jgi:O-antigen ligase